MKRIVTYIFAILCVASCVKNGEAQKEKTLVPFEFGRDMQTQIIPFVAEGEDPLATKANLEGNQFESGDLIRLRLVCPFVTGSEYGENTWGNTYDNWFLLEWGGAEANWKGISSDRGFDFNGDFKQSGSYGLHTLVQATVYVFTATTWTEEIHYVAPSNSDVITTFSNVFKADQRREVDFKASDVLWAQQLMQTGTPNVRLSFNHKMALLRVTLDSDLAALVTSGDAVLTLENMPDLDQKEVVVGNYYANKLKSKSNYGEYYRSACDFDHNGKVIGIVYPGASHLERKTIESLDQTGVYTALKRTADTFEFIIPPYTVPDGVRPTLWLRSGSNRWNAELTLPDDRTFESGIRYNITMHKPATPVIE